MEQTANATNALLGALAGEPQALRRCGGDYGVGWPAEWLGALTWINGRGPYRRQDFRARRGNLRASRITDEPVSIRRPAALPKTIIQRLAKLR